jgi:hypothetical protein
MTLLLFFVLLLLPLSSFAQTGPPMPQGGNITVIPTPLGYAYALPHGGSVEVIGKDPRQQWYSARDGAGHTTTGYIFSPFAPTHAEPPLTVPESSSRPTFKSDSDIGHEACVAMGRC